MPLMNARSARGHLVMIMLVKPMVLNFGTITANWLIMTAPSVLVPSISLISKGSQVKSSPGALDLLETIEFFFF